MVVKYYYRYSLFIKKVRTLYSVWIIYVHYYSYSIFSRYLHSFFRSDKYIVLVAFTTFKSVIEWLNSQCNFIENYMSLLSQMSRNFINTYSRTKCVDIRVLMSHNNYIIVSFDNLLHCLSLNTNLNSRVLLHHLNLTTEVRYLFTVLNNGLISASSKGKEESCFGFVMSLCIFI